MINYLSFLVFPTFFHSSFSCLILQLSDKMFQRLSSSCQSSINLSVSNNMRTDLIYRDIIFQINSNFCFSVTFFLPCQIRFIHFHFQLVEKFEHVQTFQLIEINFRFVENVKFSVITLHNLSISINRIQFNGQCNARLKYFADKVHCIFCFCLVSLS